ncbi:hypothetical protein MCG98_18595 [Ruminococcus sp. OA3]|uniref:hypothetical protein n=1 Tax=Ruminococcus sp. OA3 TaxID=2914164 RepID=UPI001F05CED4|nr:hypothetical protein [Ruminococcus sp. OA3]MCH1984567.1 hypothetical protein [Ruminococcus sp. OA3]
MAEFIKVPLTARMKKDYEECAKLMDDGIEKDCSECSMNGGNLGCIGEYSWRRDVND